MDRRMVLSVPEGSPEGSRGIPWGALEAPRGESEGERDLAGGLGRLLGDQGDSRMRQILIFMEYFEGVFGSVRGSHEAPKCLREGGG